ncbi:sugar transferase [Roseibacterium sp. SDUM158016]|uniref:sugar transferase n=1 Tax=Roseicyclus sediminis TaxID=2980997 RepID=UPI0021D383BF|nr:sugar transferase [Roseibacterium sp. SDUM158016]MCU4652841.1 sugar transferase [Roseibacterium sp. SDUM158016]
MTLSPDIDDVLPPRPARDGAAWPDALGKRLFDMGFSAAILLPAAVFVALCLLVLNPVLNPGPLLYRPLRMGRDCRPFHAWKFRTMQTGLALRGPDDPVETERIGTLGRLLRRARFDELPQIANVFRGEMSLIGPRPDDFAHARAFVSDIPGYRQRHSVRPGISGLAQVELGYAEGREATRAKTAADLRYIRGASLRLDLWIFWRTICTVIDLRGA